MSKSAPSHASAESAPQDRSVVSRYAAAVVVPALIITFYFNSSWFALNVPPLLWLTLGVLLVATWGGLWPGLIATAFCAVAANFILLTPGFPWLAINRNNAILIGTFVATSSIICGIAEGLQRAIRRERRYARDLQENDRRTRQAMRESEQHFREFAESMQHLVWTCRPDGTCDFLSAQWVAYTGRPAEEQLGDGWIDAVHPADRETALCVWSEATASGTALDVEFRIRRFDGEYRWFKTRAVPVRDEHGAIKRWYGSNTDIEDLKRAQDAAVHAAEQRMLAVEAAGMGAWEWNVETGGVTWSDRAFEMFGVPRDQQPSVDLFLATVHPEDRERVAATLKASLAADPPIYQCEYRVVRPDGTVRWLFGKGAARDRAEEGTPKRMIGITVDVTDRVLGARELAAALDAAKAANRAKDAFLAALSHELRTPLTPVLFLAATLERSEEVPAPLRADFAMIRRNIELEARLIDDLLDLTRITRGKLHFDIAPVDLHAVLERSIEMLRDEIAARELRLELDLSATLTEASSDALRLQQVFWNVLRNAVKFTPAGGTITVRSQNLHGGTWHVAIRDTGHGITADELPHIFDAFAQGREANSHRYGGLGLGLAISRLLAKELGGRIWAESEGRERGATFHIELSLLAQPSEPKPQAAPPRAASAAGSGRILIVEDHSTTRKTLERILGEWGYQVATAEGAASARALVTANTFDLMISDLGLPDGNGHELAVEFAQAYGLRAIALSGYGMEDDVRRSMTAGFLTHITKPVDIAILRDAINLALLPA